ncbi:MAG: radical SAM protein [bacterium]
MQNRPTLLLIEPKAPNLHIFSGMSLPRLGTILLGTQARDRGWKVTVIIEEQAQVDWSEVSGFDLVGISTITSTAPRAYAMADRVRSLNVPVIIGGPHVTFLPEEALNHADYVMRGEGEAAFPVFLDTFLQAGEYGLVPSLTWRKQDGTITHNDLAPAIANLDTLPTPDFSLVRGRTLRMGGKAVVPVQTSRGCPYDCSFCSVTSMFGRKFRFRSTRVIMEELERYDSRENYLFFYDDNFMASPKRAYELLDAMIERKFKFRWSAQVRADLARDEEVVKRMRRAGCHTVFIGFESVSPEALVAIRKKANVEDLRHAADTFRKIGIHVHGMFILGLDSDSMQTVRQTVRFARRHRIGTAQFLILTPLPGSAQFEVLKREGRIAFTDWSLYDAHHVVYKPTNFSLAGLQRAQISAHRAFYSLRDTVRRLLSFHFGEFVVAIYARKLNRNWKKKNKAWLTLLSLLGCRKNLTITADVRQIIELDASNREHAA